MFAGRRLRTLRKFCDDTARQWISDAKPTAQIFQHAAGLVEHGDHFRPVGDNTVKTVPLGDKTILPVTGLDQCAVNHAVKRCGLLVEIDEGLFLTLASP